MTKVPKMPKVENQNHHHGSTKDDELVKSQKMTSSVIPAKAGIQEQQALLDPGACPGPRSGIRRGDGFDDFLRMYQR